MNRVMICSGALGIALIGCQSQPTMSTETTAAAQSSSVNEVADIAADRVVLHVSGLACPF